MILYKKKTLSALKFIIAFIVFMLGLTITFDEVFGQTQTNTIQKSTIEKVSK